MRGFRFVLLIAALLLPTSALAIPVSIELHNGFDFNANGAFAFSFLDEANQCSQGGFFVCGNSVGYLSGTLTADRDGQLLSGITGDLNMLGVDYAVSGSLDFSAATVGGVAGSLSIGSLGVFEFWNTPIAGEANSLDGTDLRLWGQNFARYTAVTPQGGYGIHLGGTISDSDGELGQPTEGGGQVPAVPEPGSAALFGLGTLVVMIRGRRA